jgi:hypothetical protein
MEMAFNHANPDHLLCLLNTCSAGFAGKSIANKESKASPPGPANHQPS